MKNVDLPKETPNSSTAAKRPSLKLNALSNWGVLCVNIIIGLLLTPAIAKHLQDRRFGMWMLISSIVGYFGLLRLGFGTGVLRYVPVYRSKGDMNRVSSIISTAMVFYLIVGILIFSVSWFFSDFISNFFGGGQEFSRLIALLGLAAAIECPFLLFDSAIRGYEGFVYVNLVAVISAVTRALGLVTCIILGWGLVAMGWTLVFVSLVALAGGWIVFTICCKGAAIRFNTVNFSDLKMLFFFGLAIVLAGVADLLTYSTPRMIVGKVISLEAVGLFGVAALLVGNYRSTVYAITRVFMPRFSYLSGRDADQDIRRLFLKGTRFATVFAGLVATGIWTVGPSFVRLWMDKDFSPAVPALMILTGGAFVLLSHRMSIDLLYGLGRQNYIATIGVIEGFAVVVLSLLLSFKYGLSGVALGVAVPMIIVRAILQAKYVCRIINVSVWHFYSKCILRPWLVSIVIAVSMYLLGAGKYADGWISLFVVSSLIMFLYAVSTYTVAVESSEKKQIRLWLLRLLQPAPANR